MRQRDRFFAGFMAVLFAITTIAFSALVVWQMTQDTNETANQTADTAPICQTTDIEEAIPVPEIYKPEGDVTELTTTDLKEGNGKAAEEGDCLVVKYYGTLASNGEKFDENYTTTNAFALELGTGSVIAGWEEGLVGMKEGGERRLVIPADKAYGDQAMGTIPANSDLVFVVTLLRIKN